MHNHHSHSCVKPYLMPSAALMLALITLISNGCVRLAANMLYVIRGNDIPAEYDGMKESRIAVVCTTTGSGASETINSLISSNVISGLSRNLAKADLVKQEEIERLFESESWDNSDPVQLAKAVKADFLVAVAVDNLKLREGATLFRGQCDIRVTVYDVKDKGRIVFEKQMPEHSFPKNGGTPVTDTTEAKFRSTYLQLVAYKVSSLFHPVDPTFDIALDATASKL